MAILNIEIEVPNKGAEEMRELKHKLTVYAKMLVSSSLKSTSADKTKKYNHEVLAGIFAEESEENSLRDEYIKDKYRI